MLPGGIIYLVVNYLGTVVRGEPVYPFLNWKDFKSPIIGLVLVLSGKFAYDGVCFLINKFSSRKSKKQ